MKTKVLECDYVEVGSSQFGARKKDPTRDGGNSFFRGLATLKRAQGCACSVSGGKRIFVDGQILFENAMCLPKFFFGG